jgi:hypothetical protein
MVMVLEYSSWSRVPEDAARCEGVRLCQVEDLEDAIHNPVHAMRAKLLTKLHLVRPE